jgi:hypothetical protein
MNLEFYTIHWVTIRKDLLTLMNHMFHKRHLSRKQKQGITVHLPKCNFPKRVSDFRSITLLTSEYKILAQIMAQRLKRALAEHLCTTQYCGLGGNTILDAVACVRDVVAYADSSGTPVCVLSLDFEQAFDRLSHQLLFEAARSFGISDDFCNLIKALYELAEALVQTNGTLS